MRTRVMERAIKVQIAALTAIENVEVEDSEITSVKTKIVYHKSGEVKAIIEVGIMEDF